jgi:pteridine reductase
MTKPVALITGGAKRIGAALVQSLHQQGFDIALHYRHSLAEAQALASSLCQQRANSVLLLTADASDINSLNSFPEKINNHFGRLDVLINNASSFYPTPMGSATLTAWHELIDSNVKMAFFLSQAVAPLLRLQSGSSIINITDVNAVKVLKEYSLYCLAKSALKSLTENLALQYAPDIRVNAIAPGWVLANPAEDNITNPEQLAQRWAKIPLQKMGTPQAICQAAWYLIHADYVTGHTLYVDGGRHLV